MPENTVKSALDDIRSAIRRLQLAANTIQARLDDNDPVQVLEVQAPEFDWELFDRFWGEYPRKTNKKGARAAWKKLNPERVLVLRIILGVRRLMSTRQWQEGMIPHASTFINGERWEDDAFDVVDAPPVRGDELF